ncbi:UvrD-helicase domain-containing protein [Nocardia farcinica]|uniref:ATP-dependent helicase n=1 Tax=Nocardia farcinica TaxID=37329 RepID=UPI001896066B|nr:UvrD-helicase domain-containing protein [Nocardia farcinica]MBF6421310.1 UvrD-helicase domain-containing protein [Nocardia farcinica]MBF6432970.1 UvrD-helicase domain-containing protein [Nocardia farcinica]MBF6503469.1 UvrD-helicase domain-containing protein [Nocardia farcinica]
MTVSPHRIADALGLPPPTDEQAAVIAAPPGPTLVVAGAGAGKTETMAARVVWMVANRLVLPEQVLGLTFTRKAAQQLTARIRTRLARLAGSALLRELDSGGELRAQLAGAEPEISTYHSYAGRLLSEHGLLLPVEPSATLLTETQLWQLAHQVVRNWDGDLDTERTPVSVTEAVLALSGQLAEHLVEPEELAEAHAELEKLINTLPAGPRQRGGPSKALRDIVRVQHERVALLPLVRALNDALRRRGALDFGAQMSLAARLAAEHPEVAQTERGRFRLVLLDEYQDTGHAQRVLLAALFGGAAGDPEGTAGGRAPRPAVTAVGDPMQSIYGWRGASAANLPRFATDFPCAPGVPAPILPLLTSWRNPPEALALANLVAEPLRQAAREAGGATVDALRAKPGAEPGVVALALTETVVDERGWVAERIAAEWAARRAAGEPPPTSAVLVRRNADAAPLAEALREQGLPVEIVGLGGLLATPEVADIVATLRLIAEPGAGSAALRVLTGARWRIGVADLAALSRRARELSVVRTDTAVGAEITDGAALEAALREVAPEPVEQAGLADAIADPGPAENYSAAGYQRIEALGRELAALRERSGQPLTELVADVERTIGVGVETQARRAVLGAGAGREHLDAFAEVVAGYAADPGASLGGLLAFLTAAESVENGLEPGEVEVAKDRVQVLTVHAAKGLEWEIVAVPHVVRRVFPSGTAGGTWLGALPELPTALRGDRVAEDAAEGVPVLDLTDLYDRADLERALAAHKAALERRRIDEERRLFYVALTRTERVLLVSAHHWAETGDPKGPSDFLLELKSAAETPDGPAHGAVEIARWDDPPPVDAVNPFADNPATAEWPRDPLGPRRDPVEQGAALVRAALAELRAPTVPRAPAVPHAPAVPRPAPRHTPTVPPPTDTNGALPSAPNDGVPQAQSPDLDPVVTDVPTDPDDPEGWAADVDALLAEHEATVRAAREVELPGQLPATALVELRADPAKLARRLRRPLPYPPNPLARRGTAFHAWVQRWFSGTRLLGFDELPGAGEPDPGEAAADAGLARMQDAFLNSAWAHRSPIDVEVPFETSIAGTVIRGRMDAVFAEPDGRWVVVDWKTGAEPDPGDEPAVAMQLAIYRLAWARLMAARTGGDEQAMLHRVDAAFHYVRSGRTIAPADLPGPDELAELIRAAAPPREGE